jgi:hypothetical protein
MRRATYLLAAVLGCGLAQAAFGQPAAKDSQLAQIFADWQHRQGLLKTVRYVITGTTEFKDPPLPPGNPVRPRRTVLLLDFERKRYRQETSEGAISERGGKGLAYVTRVGTSAFDGKSLQTYGHRELNGIEDDVPDMSIETDVSRARFDAHLWPVFFAHGMIPTAQHILRPDQLPRTYDPEDFEVRGRLALAGRSCTVVRTDPVPAMEPMFDELWVDLGRESAICRYVVFTGSDPYDRHDVEWKQTEFGWWPSSWTLTWTINRQVRRIYRLQVESFEPNPAVADSDFTLPAEPGMKVCVVEPVPPGTGLDPFRPATRTYVVSPSGSWQQVDARGFTTKEGKLLPPRGSWGWVWWTCAVGAGIAVAAFAYYVYRRRRRAAAR